jgi:hypothetical protein
MKTFAILLFLCSSTAFFILRDHGSLEDSGWEHIPTFSLTFSYMLGLYAFSFTQPTQVPALIKDERQAFRGPLFSSMVIGMLVKIGFGMMGAAAYGHASVNMFDDLFFSEETPIHVAVSVFIFSVIVVLPSAVRASVTAKEVLYITGMMDEPWNVIIGIILPWIMGTVVNHLQIYAYLVNWTALISSMYVQFVCPMFMWSKASKEASIYESNFKTSMQMILALTTPSCNT